MKNEKKEEKDFGKQPDKDNREEKKEDKKSYGEAVAKFPYQEASTKGDEEREKGDVREVNEAEPQRHGERTVEQFYLPEDDPEKEEGDRDRLEDNVDDIAKTIMSLIDAVDKENKDCIKTICIEIGLE